MRKLAAGAFFRDARVVLFDTMPNTGRAYFFQDHTSGLKAVLVIDDLRLGPAAGGIRTGRYDDELSALTEASRLARAMSVKCALAGLDAGGGKTVVLHPGAGERWQRAAAFRALGAFIEELGGLYRCAGDLGTSAADLANVAERTEFVHTETPELADSVARGALACMRVALERCGAATEGASVAIQGCGAIGAALARRLHGLGCRLHLADLDDDKARQLADELSAAVHDPAALLTLDVDVLAPCATGGVISDSLVSELRCRALVGAANNVLTSLEVASHVEARGIVHVPDVLASAGAVIDGIGRSVMGLEDRGPLIDQLGQTAAEILERAAREGKTAERVAQERAKERMNAVG